MKITKNVLLLWVLVPFAAIGCGGTGDDTTSVAAADLAMPIFKVVSGTYNVSGLTAVGTDTCMQNLDSTNFTTIGVTNDGNGHLSLGSNNSATLSDPTLYSNGTGTFTDSYHVTTHLDDAGANSAGCMYHLVRTNVVTVTADNTLSVMYTQSQTNHMGTCTVVATDCTDSYNYTATKP
jgi:hypothetical protein